MTPQTRSLDINQVELSPSQASGFASGLCVANEDYNPNEISLAAGAAGLFSEDTHETLYAKSVHERMYPASLTKIMTCLVALKYGNLDDVVTVGQECYNIAHRIPRWRILFRETSSPFGSFSMDL